MRNKEIADGIIAGRPCFLSFVDMETSINWMIPISSKVHKYKTLYDKKVSRYGKCDTIEFGFVLGAERAFLIQNMCPAIPLYIDKVYKDRAGNLVSIRGNFEKQLLIKARKVLMLQRRGLRLILPDVLKIEKQLLKIHAKISIDE